MANPELPETDDFVRPPAPRKYLTVRQLRDVVIARHKYLASSRPAEEAFALIQDNYGSDDSSTTEFLTWLRGGEPEQPPTKGGAVERIHVKTDPDTGVDHRVDTQPGSIPPRA